MARIRTVKPEMAQDEDLANVSIAAQLLAVRILNHADDEGYFKANPALIKATCFPLIDSVNIPGMLQELSNIGYLRLAKGADGKNYGFVVSFSKHQRVSHPYASKIKELATFTEHSVNDTGTLPEHSAQEKEGNRKGKERNTCAPTGARFDEWYEKYPKKRGKAEARKTWKRRKLDRIADEIIADTISRTKLEWKDPQFIPMASTYVNQERWQDEIETSTTAHQPKPTIPADPWAMQCFGSSAGYPIRDSEPIDDYRMRLGAVL